MIKEVLISYLRWQFQLCTKYPIFAKKAPHERVILTYFFDCFEVEVAKLENVLWLVA